MADVETLEARLKGAEDALHELLLGQGVVSVDYDGAATTFTRANEPGLRRYIRQLKRELGQNVSAGSRKVIL